MRRLTKHGSDDQEQNLAKLRRKLEGFLSQCLKDEQFSSPLRSLNEHLPVGGQSTATSGTSRPSSGHFRTFHNARHESV